LMKAARFGRPGLMKWNLRFRNIGMPSRRLKDLSREMSYSACNYIQRSRRLATRNPVSCGPHSKYLPLLNLNAVSHWRSFALKHRKVRRRALSIGISVLIAFAYGVTFIFLLWKIASSLLLS
jgi:hypothetical protein